MNEMIPTVCETCHKPFEEGHRPYARSGIASVTQIGKLFELSSDGLLNWAAGLAADCALDNTDWHTMTREDAHAYIKSASQRSNAETLALGTAVHHYMEHWARGEEVTYSNSIFEPFMEAANKWWQKFKPEFIAQELIVSIYDTIGQEASTIGTLDAIGTLEINNKRVPAIWDYKNVRGIKSKPVTVTNFFQQWVYHTSKAIIWDGDNTRHDLGWTLPIVDTLAVVQFREDGKYRMTTMSPDDMQFVGGLALLLYREMKEVKIQTVRWL